MLRVGICDDEINICAEIEAIIHRYMKVNNCKIIIDVFYSAEKLMNHMKNEGTYDLIFLDIEMQKVSGIDLGKSIRDEWRDEVTKIVYISWNRGYALDLFQIRPLDFMIKPIESERVFFNIEKTLELLDLQTEYFLYQTENVRKKIPVNDILYFESANRLIHMMTVSGDVEFYGKLEEISERLDSKYFWRIHKSYLINYAHGDNFDYKSVVMDDGRALPISQSQRKSMRELQRNLIAGGE